MINSSHSPEADLRSQLDIARAVIGLLQVELREKTRIIQQAKDITPVARASFRRVMLLARAACLDLVRLSDGTFRLSLGRNTFRVFKCLKDIWDILVQDDWSLSELFGGAKEVEKFHGFTPVHQPSRPVLCESFAKHLPEESSSISSHEIFDIPFG
jgi:hypothetical protein